MASNATRGHVWDQFSSETYKQLPPRRPSRISTTRAIRTAHRLRRAGRRTRLLPDGIADRHVGDGAVPAQQLGRRVRQGSVREARHGGVRRRDGEAAVAGAASGVRSIPVTTIDSTVRISGTTVSWCPDGHARRSRGARRSDASCRARAATALVLKLRSDDALMPRLLREQPRARFRRGSGPHVRRRAARSRQARAHRVPEDVMTIQERWEQGRNRRGDAMPATYLRAARSSGISPSRTASSGRTSRAGSTTTTARATRRASTGR